MTSQSKNLLKQTLLLVLISALFYLLGSIGSYVQTYGGPWPLEEYIIFYVYFFLMGVCFIPTSIFYFLRKRKNIKLTRLNIAFKIFCGLLISTLSAFFIFGIYDSFYLSWPELYQANILKQLWFMIKFIDTDKVTNLLYYLPTLISAGLLYYAIRINKLLVKAKD